MTTLERIEKLEKQLGGMAGLVELAAKSVADQPKIIQELGSIRSFAQQVANNLKSTVDQFNKAIKSNMDFSQLTVNRALAIEQSLTSLAKTTAALVAELADTKVINQSAIMTRIRKIDEENERIRTKEMLKADSIKAADAVTATSYVIASQDVTPDGKEKELIREYMALELTSQELPKEIKDILIGKKVGETAEIHDPQGKETLHFKVLEIYELVTRKSPGSPQAPGPVKTAPPAPVAPSSATNEPTAPVATTPATTAATPAPSGTDTTQAAASN